MANITLVSELVTPAATNTGVDYIDGVRVNPNLFNFATALRGTRGFTDCKFGIIQADTERERGQLFVYFPGELYCRGQIGYGDIAVGDTVMYKYYVDSRSISNNKIASWRSRHTTLGSQNVKKAISNARAHLREYSPKVIYELTAEGVGNQVDDIKNDSRNAKDKVASAITDGLTDNGMVTEEFRHMLLTDYQFKNAEFGALIANYINSIDSNHSVLERKVNVSMVIVYPQLSTDVDGKVTALTSSAPVKLRAGWFKNQMDTVMSDGVVTSYTRSTLPMEIKSKVQSLSILDAEQYVDHLGYRVSENIFYIIEDI